MKFKLSVLSLSSLFLLSACGNKPEKHTEALKLLSSPAKHEITSEDWKLPEFSRKEKKDLIYSVQTVFNDFYVHRSQKKHDYNYDSQAEANTLSVNMSSEELLRKVAEIYTNVRDFHTIFIYPVPARCVIGGFPLDVKLAYESDEKGVLQEKLIITQKFAKILKSEFVTASDQESYASLSPGDEILAISNLGLENGPTGVLSTNEALGLLSEVSKGANEDAARTRAAQNFFSRSGGYMKPPSGRFQLTVKKASDQSVTTFVFPWLAYQSAANVCQDFNLENKDKSNSPSSLPLNNLHLEQNNNLSQFLQKTTDNDRFMKRESFKDVYANGDDDENISKKIVEHNGKKFAFVRIDAFVPAAVESSFEEHYLSSRQSIIEEVNGLRQFILDHRDEVEGLIFDVRDNGGGYGVFPQLIANAFTSEFVPNLVVQPLVSQKNRETFHNLEFSRYFKRLGTKDPLVDRDGNILTAPRSETADEMDFYLSSPEHQNQEVILSPAARFDEDENDELPPEYTADYKKRDSEKGTPGKYAIKEIFTTKPVAVLVNSHCYSSCDIFSSLLKDYNIAKMFGETEHTGGGGANVVEWNSFAQPVVIDASGTKAPIVPNAKTLPRDIRMRFAWNRIVREKAVDQEVERYIEGVGIIIPKSNVLKPTIKDVLTNDSVIFEKIMTDMIEHASTYPINR